MIHALAVFTYEAYNYYSFTYEAYNYYSTMTAELMFLSKKVKDSFNSW